MDEKPGLSKDHKGLAEKIGIWLGLAAFCWLFMVLVVITTVSAFRWLF